MSPALPLGAGAAVIIILFTTGCASVPEHADAGPAPDPPAIATFSIVGIDESSGDLGIAVASKFLGVGSVVPWARAGVGAVATQAWANVGFGPDGLELMAAGRSAREALDQLIGVDSRSARRQVGIVDARGRSASHTGAGCLDWAGHREGAGYACQGNILADEQVVEAMAAAFEKSRESGKGELAHWLMAALRAGDAAGGDRRGRQSAALLVVRAGGGYAGGNDRYIDLRVEDHERPIRELTRLLALHEEFFEPAHARRPTRRPSGETPEQEK